MADYSQWSLKDEVWVRTGKTIAYGSSGETSEECKWGRNENKMPGYENKTTDEIKRKVKKVKESDTKEKRN
jgi:hypothetical protein